mmetsp:Transcript_11326/g.29028  ORF Transcript_11326/g.29028 Transcript_11326/m.29028 type:complete len:394 (-) Transcript_11326:262-1443(-)
MDGGKAAPGEMPAGPLLRAIGAESVADWRSLATIGALVAGAAAVRQSEGCPPGLGSFALFAALLFVLRLAVLVALRCLAWVTDITQATDVDDELVAVLQAKLGNDVALESFLAFHLTVAWDLLDGQGILYWLNLGFMVALAVTAVRVASSLAAVAMSNVASGMYARAGEKVVAVATSALALMVVCDNLGIKLTGLLASLGVSGLLVALSMQTLLQDAFASVILAMDEPFRKNDSISLEGGVAGTVESIGLKTTYLRDFGGSLLVLPNKELCSRVIENHSKQNFRRNVMTFEFSPDSDIDALEALPRDLNHAIDMLRSEHDVTDRSCLVKGAGEWGILVEIVYIVRGNVPLGEFREMNSQVAMNMLRAFRARRLQLASAARLQALSAGRRPLGE